MATFAYKLIRRSVNILGFVLGGISLFAFAAYFRTTSKVIDTLEQQSLTRGAFFTYHLAFYYIASLSMFLALISWVSVNSKSKFTLKIGSVFGSLCTLFFGAMLGYAIVGYRNEIRKLILSATVTPDRLAMLNSLLSTMYPSDFDHPYASAGETHTSALKIAMEESWILNGFLICATAGSLLPTLLMMVGLHCQIKSYKSSGASFRVHEGVQRSVGLSTSLAGSLREKVQHHSLPV